MASTSAEENEEVVRRYVEEVVDGGDRDAAEELIAPDYVRHDEQYDPGGVVEMLQAFEAFPDHEVTIGKLLADDEYVMFTAVARGTHERGFMGIEPTGRSFETSGMVIHRLEDGKIAETWANWDILGMLHQLDIDPEETREDGRLKRFRDWLVRPSPPRGLPHA